MEHSICTQTSFVPLQSSAIHVHLDAVFNSEMEVRQEC